MAINIQNLTAAEKEIQSKYIQIGNGLLPDAIKTVEKLYPSVLNVWEHKYLIVNEMLMAIGYDKIGAWLSKNEVMMYIRQACAYETKNNNAKEGVVKDLPYAFAHILMVRKADANLLTELYKDKMISEAQIERVKAARDRIAVRVKVSEKDATHTTANNSTARRAPQQRQTDPEIAAAINAASKPDTVYNFNALISSLQEEGLRVEMKDGYAHIFVNVDKNWIDAGIIRPGNIVADLSELKDKCLSLGKGINLSIIIHRASNNKDENVNNKAEASAKVTQKVNPYEGLAQEKAEKPQVLTFDLDLEYQKPGDIPRVFHVTRKISVLHEGNFYHGYVYHSNGQYLGHWYWNVKYLRPIFTSNQDIGDGNKDRYEVAIRKALKTIGVYCIYMPESADRKSKAI